MSIPPEPGSEGSPSLPRGRGKPTRFAEAVGDEFVRLVADGETIKAAAAKVGIGVRTLYEWRFRGRVGDAPFAEWEARVADALRAVRRGRRAARRAREEAAAKVRWKRFKADQIAHVIAKIGAAAFWRNRLVWLLSHGHHRAYADTLRSLRAV